MVYQLKKYYRKHSSTLQSRITEDEYDNLPAYAKEYYEEVDTKMISHSNGRVIRPSQNRREKSDAL